MSIIHHLPKSPPPPHHHHHHYHYHDIPPPQIVITNEKKRRNDPILNTKKESPSLSQSANIVLPLLRNTNNNANNNIGRDSIKRRVRIGKKFSATSTSSFYVRNDDDNNFYNSAEVVNQNRNKHIPSIIMAVVGNTNSGGPIAGAAMKQCANDNVVVDVNGITLKF
eukprot:PhM_4_TR3327/c0_g1_i1/m.71597